MRTVSTLREKCLSIILLFAITKHISAQEKKPEYLFSKKLLADKRLLEIKNQKWRYNDCFLKIIAETNEVIKLKPYDTSQRGQDIEIEILVVRKDKLNAMLYVVLEGEKHEIELISVFHIGGLKLVANGKFEELSANHSSHCSHFSSNPTF